jgi:hypothetical protein
VHTNTTYTCKENLTNNCVNFVAVRARSSLRPISLRKIFSWPLILNFHSVGGEKSGALSGSDIGKEVVASRVSKEFLGTDIVLSVCRRCTRLHNNYHHVLIIIKLLYSVSTLTYTRKKTWCMTSRSTPRHTYSCLISLRPIYNTSDVRYFDQADCLPKLLLLDLLLSNNSIECLLILYPYFVSFLFISFLIFSRTSTAYDLFSAFLLIPYRLPFFLFVQLLILLSSYQQFLLQQVTLCQKYLQLMWLVWQRKTVFCRWLIDSQRTYALLIS